MPIVATRRSILQSAALLGASRLLAADAPARRPNILWILSDDHGPHLGCYGTKGARTPNLDRLAAGGTLYRNAFVTAPVCSPSRSAIFTGNYQTTIGCHHHRSTVDLPAGVEPIGQHFRRAGYFTVIKAKTDFNFRHDLKTMVDADDWKGRKAGQPFFAQVSIIEPHRRGSARNAGETIDFDAFAYARNVPEPVRPEDVEVPPYYPDDPVVRRDIAGYLSALQVLDQKLGVLLKRLEDEGLADNTLVFFMGDNGICMPRGKQFLYDGGMRVPLIVRWPGVVKAGAVEDRLVSAIDLAATSLSAAGLELPRSMEGRPFVGPGAVPAREQVFAARDRCDETVDRIRCVRTARFKFIRNLMPERPYTQPNRYKETGYPTLAVMRKWKAEGRLNEAQSAFMADRRPEEELYDLESDPHELKNLAGAASHEGALRQLRAKLEEWIKSTGDKGQFPEKPQNVRGRA
jgi:uncharacterized sulfatase